MTRQRSSNALHPIDASDIHFNFLPQIFDFIHPALYPNKINNEIRHTNPLISFQATFYETSFLNKKLCADLNLQAIFRAKIILSKSQIPCFAALKLDLVMNKISE